MASQSGPASGAAGSGAGNGTLGRKRCDLGLLFFNKAPDRFFPYTQIDVVWFPEGAGGDRFDEKIFKGPLARMTRDALSFIQRNYLIETVLKHPDRAEATRAWNFPYVAIEEAVVNAVYHRSYEEREPIEVRISYDELVILSFPGPDRSIKTEDFEAGRSVSRRYRNRRIGEFLKELDLTEGRFDRACPRYSKQWPPMARQRHASKPMTTGWLARPAASSSLGQTTGWGRYRPSHRPSHRRNSAVAGGCRAG